MAVSEKGPETFGPKEKLITEYAQISVAAIYHAYPSTV